MYSNNRRNSLAWTEALNRKRTASPGAEGSYAILFTWRGIIQNRLKNSQESPRNMNAPTKCKLQSIAQKNYLQSAGMFENKYARRKCRRLGFEYYRLSLSIFHFIFKWNINVYICLMAQLPKTTFHGMSASGGQSNTGTKCFKHFPSVIVVVDYSILLYFNRESKGLLWGVN